jgi:hypothetical protein
VKRNQMGLHRGRRQRKAPDIKAILELRQKGVTYADIAERLWIPLTTVARICGAEQKARRNRKTVNCPMCGKPHPFDGYLRFCPACRKTKEYRSGAGPCDTGYRILAA